jgi:hypothetical protein
LIKLATLSLGCAPLEIQGIIETQFFFLAAGLGIEETDAFDVAAISRTTAIAYHDVIKRALLGATASQSN